ncbi:MAG: hypothetical protein K8F25_06875 [Fimbriimonadaceae bacterium]|nr:hypothetical protein [Alphaproteobacteria bacterium]
MRFPVTSAFGLATSTLEAVFRQFIPLLTAFILPDCATRLFYFLEAWLSARAGSASYFPFWFTESVDLFLMSIVFVSVIRFMVLGEKPQLLHGNLPLRALILTALGLVTLWLVLNQIANQSLLYGYYIESHIDSEDLETRLYMGKIIALYAFVVHTVTIAFFYLFLGYVATTSRIEIPKVMRWHRGSFLGILLLTALLIAAISMANLLYWKALWQVVPEITGADRTTIEFFDGRIAAMQELLHLPMAFFYDVIPPIAVALLMIGFSKEKVQMSNDPSVVAD